MSREPDLRDLRAVIINPGFIDGLLSGAKMNAEELVIKEALSRQPQYSPSGARAKDLEFGHKIGT